MSGGTKDPHLLCGLYDSKHLCSVVVIPAKETRCLQAHVTFSDVFPGTSQPRVTQGLFVSEVFGPDPPPLRPLSIFPAISWTFKHSQLCRGHFLCPLGLWDQNLDPHTHLVDGNCWPGIRSGGLGMEEAGIRRAGRRVISPEQPSPSLQPPSQILSGSVSHPG